MGDLNAPVMGAVVLAMSAVPIAQGSQASGSANTASQGKASADTAFVMKAARGGMAEVELGKLHSDRIESLDGADIVVFRALAQKSDLRQRQ